MPHSSGMVFVWFPKDSNKFKCKIQVKGDINNDRHTIFKRKKLRRRKI